MATPKSYTLSGRITDRSGAPLAGLTVRATDLDPHTPENALGKPAQTDADGRYTIRYTDADFRLPKESGGADIVVRVYDPSGNLLGQSALHRNAGKNTTIDVQVEYAAVEAPEENGETRVLEFARIINLPQDKAELLAARKINLHEANAATLESLVQENILTQKQKAELGLAIDLSRLGGENFELIRALKNDRLTSVSEFADWEKADWEKALRDNRIAVPKEEKSLEAYAENLRNNIEKSFPTPYLLKRLIKKDYQPELEGLEAIGQLHAQNRLLLDGRTARPAEIDWRGVSEASREKIEKSLDDLAAFANTYQYLGIRNIINNQQLNPKDKKAAISKRLDALDAFYRNNPDLDFESANFVEAENTWNWSGIEASERKLVKSQMMAYQRTLELTNDYQSCRKLLEKGYDSALAIARMPEVKFLKETGLGKTQGRKIYTSAQQKASGAILALAAMQDLNKGLFGNTNVSNLGNITNVLREWDGYEALFGAQQFCDCEHCRSIFGPAAYFVDLMHFVEEHVSEEGFIKPGHTNHPLYLKNRRPDLWRLQLTCANTNTEIPYLTVVNEVLEQYLEHEQGTTDIYSNLQKATASMGLPFNLPLEEMRLYLSHFGVSLSEVFEMLGVSSKAQAMEKLQFSSDAEVTLIHKKDVAKAKAVFGNENLRRFDVQRFLRYAGISREDLDELLKVTAIPEIKSVKVVRLPGSDIQQYSEKLDGLTESNLDLIHRFLRLWKKTPWTLREFNLILHALQSAGLLQQFDDTVTPRKSSIPGHFVQEDQIIHNTGTPVFLQLADWITIQERLRLSAEELCAIIDTLPRTPVREKQRSLYERLFDLEKIFAGAETAILYADPSKDKIRPLLLAGLSIDENELEALLRFVGIPITEEIKLDHGLISRLYRQARIAKGLRMTIDDLIFAASINWGESAVQSLEQYTTLFRFKDWLDASPFSVADLFFILKGKESKKRHYENDMASVAAAVLEIKRFSDPEPAHPEKIALLKSYLQKMFNLSQEQLEKEFLPKLILSNINGAGIQKALEAEFDEGTPNTPADLDELVNLAREIERKVLLFRLLNFDASAISYFIANQALFGYVDLKALTLQDIRYADYYRNLIKGTDVAEKKAKVQESMALYQAGSRQFPEGAVPIIAAIWQEPESQIRSIAAADSLPLSRVAVEALSQFRAIQLFAKKLGIGGISLAKLAATEYTGMKVARDVVLGAFASRYSDEKERLTKLEPYTDKINERKRDALCEYITAQRDKYKFKDRSDLYQFFLLDVEMSGCFRTSRVVAAITSLQLYVHRCLLNLEQSDKTLNPNYAEIKVNPTWIPAAEWEWRKNYRVWEANRKVFLYPENYIDPTLRKGKTPLFKELEDELLQENITQESAEAAYKKYMAQFVELADLRYAGAYYHRMNEMKYVDLSSNVKEDGNNESNNSNNGSGFFLAVSGIWIMEESEESCYYLFARTNTQPNQYYYRTFNGYQDNWGNWKKIELSIEADEVSPLIHNGKLYLFWTEVQQKEVTVVVSGNSQSKGVEFKVYAKYAFLKEDQSWSPPQRVYVGRMSFSFETDEQLIYNRIGEVRPTDTNELDKKRDYILSQFKSKVFRKPYALISGDTSAPIKLYYIWTQKWKTKAVKYVTSAFETDFEGLKIVIPSFEFFIEDNTVFPVKQEISIKINSNEFTQIVDLVLQSPQLCKVNIFNRTEGITVSSYTPIENVFASMHKLSLSTNEIINASAEDISQSQNHYHHINDPEVSFLENEYKIAFSGNGDFNHCIERGERNFAGIGEEISQEKSGVGKLRIKDKGNSHFKLIWSSTILTEKLSDILFSKGLEQFLSLPTQKMTEDGRLLEFSGPYGNYYWELFFHIPFLIANHLNANQKFKEAKWWYERIFNPTSEEKPADQPPSDHNWQFREFRNQGIKKLKEILTDDEAIAAYRKDPFDPHSIAALRLNAYQKAIVMKYIDNLLDWGDHLFAQDTRESINEAEMLYQLAADILGERPVKMGKCDMASENAITYEKVGPEIEEDSEFLITLENWQVGLQWEYKSDIEPYRVYKDGLASLRNGKDSESKASLAEVAALASAKGFREYRMLSNSNGEGTAGKPSAPPPAGETATAFAPKRQIIDYSNKRKSDIYLRDQEERLNIWKDDPASIKDRIVRATKKRDPNIYLTQQSFLAFCVPYNTDFLAYWDRVQDRLWKIRWCMNIQGMRRSLALFQPPIDPMLLVRAKAAGLSWENLLTLDLVSPYRFSFLIEKARQFTQTVQSLGSALLSALEKKDGEELALLRSVHERNILKLTRSQKQLAIKEAVHNYQSMSAALENVENRIIYYENLIQNGLLHGEVTQQIFVHSANSLIPGMILISLISGSVGLVPNILGVAWSTGSKEAQTWLQKTVDAVKGSERILRGIAESAHLEATFQRREQEWKQQLKLAEQEKKQVEQQILAAEIRVQIAERDLEVHEKNIEQSEEVYDFYKDKFTNLGLYQFMAKELLRLYREAYQMAYNMANLAESAYRFETDDDALPITIKGDNWSADKSGLLAGEKLLVQLQQLEQSYLEKNVRRPEITQSFSLTMIDPSQLVKLRQSGSCAFKIPQIAFEMFYPGQFKRLIKSVRLSMPCIVGPYTNVSARLTLTKGEVEIESGGKLENWDYGKNTSLYASSAANDAGMFDFNFRDERYLPFEGAGAISEWQLDLPSQIRAFNYDTISDVILHISYTAREGDRDVAEKKLVEALTSYARDNGMFKLISLKNQFPQPFHQLLNPPERVAPSASFATESGHFPYFLNKENLSLNELTIYLKPKKGMSVVPPADFKVNGAVIKWESDCDIALSGTTGENSSDISSDNAFEMTDDIALSSTTGENDKMKGGKVTVSGSPIGNWRIEVSPGGLKPEELEDIFILMKYQVG